MTTDNEKEVIGFLRAARANNYKHIELQEDMALVTDFRRDGQFQPYVTVESNEIEKSDVKEQLDSLEFLKYENVHIQPQEGVAIDFADIERAEFIDPVGDE